MCARAETLRFAVRLFVTSCIVPVAAACGDDSTIASPKPEVATLTIVSGDRQTAEVGSPLPQPLVVNLRDSRRAPMPGVFVRFADEDGAVADSALTDARGWASVGWTLGPKAKAQRIAAFATIYNSTAYTLAEAAFTATAVRGPAARIQITTRQEFAAPGSPIDTVSATVMDRFENRVAGASVAWVVELGGGSVRALSTVTDAVGVARAVWTLGPTAGDNVLTATSGLLVARVTATASAGFPGVSVAVGGEHTCALIKSGEAYCWGSNALGQLGVGTTDGLPHPSPSRVAGNRVFTQLVAGTFHSCGLTPDGAAYCWGGNHSGQLGSAGNSAHAPTRVAIAQPLTALTAGAHHTCGLTTNRIVYCWGDNTAGELGDGSDRSTAAPWGLLNRNEPAPIVGGRSFIALASTFSGTCAVETTGQTYCWGGNYAGELGTVAGRCRMLADPYYYREDWDLPCSTTPVPIDSQESPTALTASGFGVCGLTSAGALMCWGATSLRPTVIPDARVSAAWSLGNIVCGVEGLEVVSCWGLWGKTDRTAPPFGDRVTLVNLSSMGSTSCGVSNTPAPVAYCWGHNYKGQVGDGGTAYRSTPVAVGLPRN